MKKINESIELLEDVRKRLDNMSPNMERTVLMFEIDKLRCDCFALRIKLQEFKNE